LSIRNAQVREGNVLRAGNLGKTLGILTCGEPQVTDPTDLQSLAGKLHRFPAREAERLTTCTNWVNDLLG